jgi:5-methylcytosine-specific restriction protein B
MVDSEELRVTNRGRAFPLSQARVESSLLNVEPERVAKYAVEIRGREYPVLQVISIATGTPKIEWSTVNAYRILQKLGFEIRVHE